MFYPFQYALQVIWNEKQKFLRTLGVAFSQILARNEKSRSESQLVKKIPWKPTDGRTRPIALPSPLTLPVKIKREWPQLSQPYRQTD